ncbi:hypothetical protein [Eubacterium callanderi]|uniref:hypothetical protein n=1 Tax=Eubacterium callanderi TaxID=53442 RepID=UPI00391DEBE6
MAEKVKPRVSQFIVTIFGLSELTALMVASLSTSYYSYILSALPRRPSRWYAPGCLAVRVISPLW